MKRIAILSAALLGSVTLAAPAHATFGHVHYCNCGHSSGSTMCGGSTSSTSSTTSGGTTSTTSSTSGGTTTSSTSSTSGGSTSTTSSTSGGTTSSTSGGSTDVPEPGMLGMMGLGFVGIAVARRRRRA